MNDANQWCYGEPASILKHEHAYYDNTACLNLLFEFSGNENLLNIKKQNQVTSLSLSSS